MHFKPVHRAQGLAPTTRASASAQSNQRTTPEALFALQWQVQERVEGSSAALPLGSRSVAVTTGGQTAWHSSSQVTVGRILQRLQRASGGVFQLRTRGAFSESCMGATAARVPAAYSAAAAGLLRVAAQEMPALTLQHTDIGATSSLGSSAAFTAADAFGLVRDQNLILSPLLCSASHLQTPHGAPLTIGGSGVLIAGGLGDIGSLAGIWTLQQSHGSSVCLLSRSGRSSDGGIPAVFAESSSLVIAAMCNAGSFSDVAGAAASFRLKARLAGVFLAGGVIRDAPFMRQTAKQLREVMAPKAETATNLAAAVWAEPLTTEFAFSSLSSLLGTPGQANYAAANMALNALATQRQAAGEQAPLKCVHADFDQLKCHNVDRRKQIPVTCKCEHC